MSEALTFPMERTQTVRRHGTRMITYAPHPVKKIVWKNHGHAEERVLYNKKAEQTNDRYKCARSMPAENFEEDSANVPSSQICKEEGTLKRGSTPSHQQQ